MQAVKYYKCPHCGMKYNSLQTWGNHVSSKHPSLIPEGWSYARYFYYIQTGKREGHCVECKNPTEWNEGSQKYARFCKNPACKLAYRNRFKSRMIGTHGTVHLLNDPEQQRKMVAARKISGTYVFQTGAKVQYTGTYELDFVRMLDTFLHFNPTDLMMPSPHTYYYEYKNPNDPEHEGRHFYIPDAFIPSLNLEIEIKQNTSGHQKILNIDKVKEMQKDALMSTQPVGYLKIVDKDYSAFFDYIANYHPEEPVEKTALESYQSLIAKRMNQKPASEAIKFVEYDPMYHSTSERDMLSKYKHGKLDFPMIKAFRSEVPTLKHVRCTSDSNGEIFFDGKHVVGYYQTETKDNCVWLQALEILDDYRGRRLGDQMLQRAINHGKITNLAVNIENEVAIRMYLKHGFIEYARTPKMMFMRIYQG